MRVHRIKLIKSSRYIDLDHIQLVEPPSDTSYDYGFKVWMAFREDPMLITCEDYTYAHILRKECIDREFKELFLAWSGHEYEVETIDK